MDSFTQIVLGAATGQVVLGRQIGNKALLYGAIAGTIPDLDIFVKYFTDPVHANAVHRGFSHSILFCLLLSPILGFLTAKIESKKQVPWLQWSQLFFWGLFTHPLLDAFTTWGTQLFWPLDWRIAFNSVFVIDPFYTLPFAFCLIMLMRLPRSNPKRTLWVRQGFYWSSAYLVIGLITKSYVGYVVTQQLEEEKISYQAISSRPAPFTIILWNINIKTKDGYLMTDYSLLDSQPMQFTGIKHRDDVVNALRAHPKSNAQLEQLIQITDGWYTLSQDDSGQWQFNDLRFGKAPIAPGKEEFVFTYKWEPVEDHYEVIKAPASPRDPKLLLKTWWKRIKGT